MLLAVAFIMSALVLYSTAIWSERWKKGLRLWMVIVIASGFWCDLIGTTLMRVIATKTVLNSHAICGFTALIIMLLHLIWAILAITKRGRSQLLFTRFSVYAWAIWMTAFILGIPKI